jgi:tetratricopeptide (TPR) repeat protein
MLLLALFFLAGANQLGAAAFAQGDYAAAGRWFSLAWEVAPRSNVASNLGAVARRLSDWPQAEHWFGQAYALRKQQLGVAHADTLIALNNRAVARLALGRWSEARRDLETALQNVEAGSADHAAMLANLGDLDLRQARLAEAEAHCREAWRIDRAFGAQCLTRLERLAVSVR